MPQTATPPDRRVRRTREVLLDALIGLMIERGYQRLTVQNLLDRTGVGRATFYAHFDGKEALLEASVARLRDALQAEWRAAPGRRLGFTLPFFRHLASHRRIYLTTILRESEVTVERHIRRMLGELVREDLARTGALKPPADELAARFVVATLWSTVVWWMDQAPELPPEAVDATFQALAFPGLDAMPGLALT